MRALAELELELVEASQCRIAAGRGVDAIGVHDGHPGEVTPIDDLGGGHDGLLELGDIVLALAKRREGRPDLLPKSGERCNHYYRSHTSGWREGFA